MTENSGAEGGRLKSSVQAVRDLKDVGQRLHRLRRRLTDLEIEVQENRRLNRRVAELTDLVQEVLLPVGQRDEEKLRALLDKYDAGH